MTFIAFKKETEKIIPLLKNHHILKLVCQCLFYFNDGTGFSAKLSKG